MRLKSADRSEISATIRSSGSRLPKFPVAISWVAAMKRRIGSPIQRVTISASSAARASSRSVASTALHTIRRAASKAAATGLWTRTPQRLSATGLTWPSMSTGPSSVGTVYSAVRWSGLRAKSRTRLELAIAAAVAESAPSDQSRRPFRSTRNTPTLPCASRSKTASIRRRRTRAWTTRAGAPVRSVTGTASAETGSFEVFETANCHTGSPVVRAWLKVASSASDSSGSSCGGASRGPRPLESSTESASRFGLEIVKRSRMSPTQGSRRRSSTGRGPG